MVYEATTLPYEGMKSLRLKIISDILEDISILLLPRHMGILKKVRHTTPNN